MNGKKIKTKLMVLLICFFFLTSVSGVSLAATVTNTNTSEKPLEIFEIKELNHAPNRSEYAPDEILVKFKSDTGNVLVSRTNSEYGASVKSTLLSGTKVLRVPSDKTVDEMVKIYESLPEVEYVEPNYLVRALMVPNDTAYTYQWHLDNDDYGGINMESAWDISTGSGVVVAVLDTGVAYEDYGIYHQAPDLAGTTFVQGYDYVNGDEHPNDDQGHGTHVTGTIAQTTNNGYGVAGVAFGCSIMPIKVLNETGSGYNSWVADGIYYAVDNGSDVISMSLGGSSPSSTIEAAVEYAYDHGVTVIAAAGNEYLDGNPTEYPAAYDDYVIAVGATRYDETRSYYSNTGSYVDVVAPGGDTSVDQNTDGYADGVLQQTFDGSIDTFAFSFMQGTSMATPHVAGVAALLIANGVTGPDNVRASLQNTAEDKGTTGWDEEYGWGLIDAVAALEFVPSDTINISEAVDNYDLNWTTGGDEDGDWSGQNDTYYYGGDAAESGHAADSQSSWLQTNVTGPGNLSFYWKVSSEYEYDLLKFDIDDVEQHYISGTTSWAQKTYSIGSGTHTLKWEYSKDVSYDGGEDCGWVDKVEYVTEGNPDIWVDPTSFTVTLSQGNTWSGILNIENHGSATLTYNISDVNTTVSVSSQDKTTKSSMAIIPGLRTAGNNNNQGTPNIPQIIASDVIKQSGTTQILAWTLYTDYHEEYNNTLSAISQYYTDYAVTESTTTSSSVLNAELVDKDIFLVTEPEAANNTILASMGSTFSTVLLDFVNNGGIVIVCCEWEWYQGFLLNAGLMNATYDVGYFTGENFTVADSTHPITDSLGSTVASADAVATYIITDPEIQNLIVDSHGFPVVAVRDLGSGHVVLIGYDYYEYNNDSARIISNAVNLDLWSTETCTWLSETPTSGSVASGSYDNITVSINTTGLSAGSYGANITIISNDPDENTIVVPVSLTVESPSEDPNIWVDPTSFTMTLSQGDAWSDILQIGNNGNATLTYNLSDANSTMSSFAQELMVRAGGLTSAEADLSVGSKTSDISTYTVKYTGLIDNLDILVLGNSSSTSDDDEVTRLNALGSNTVLVEDSAIASLTSSDLGGYDVVYLAIDWGDSSDHIEAVGDTIKTYVSNGGGLVLGQCANFDAPYTPSFLPHNLTYTDTWYPGCGVTILNSTNYITSGLTGNDMPDVYDRISTATLDANYDILAVSSVEESISLAVAEYGSGRIAVHASNWRGTGTSCDDDPDIIIERIFYWASQSEAVDCTWLTETPTSGSVSSGSYDNITVSINTTGLSTGNYSANITISSNDPDENSTVVPVTLTVNSTGEVGTGGLETVDLNSGPTPTTLANTLMGGGVVVSNVTYSGVNISAGTFSNGTEIIGFYSGIILSTGNISNVIGPNTYDGTSKDNDMPGDTDLDTLIPGYDTYDASVLEFDFVPDTAVVTFVYVFGSEEYNEYVHSEYNDVFGFFINGVNHALIPGTSTPVSINNVNGGNPYGTNAINPACYRNNDLDDGGGSINTELDGLTIVLSVTASVNAGETNHIKLAIADAGDYILDSDVFIKAESFIAPNLTLSPITANNPVDINHTLTATLIENGSGASGRMITFNITNGPNAGLTGTNTTDSEGQATWSYTSSVNGTDTIVATSASETSNTAYVTWEAFIEAFDTGTGTSPSISGTHNGTIVMSSHVNVSYMYTYPCAGTGGHAESVKIWNSTWTKTVAWTGYTGDYHNITFDESFILRAGETYNYTIITGSYPQIIHATSMEVTGGTITCTEFTDANGVTYNDYIPAIILG
ncbi:choice-of-anchor L domain-containing protein [Halobacteriota archaeon]